MAELGTFMLISMFVGGVGGAIKNNTSGQINKACSDWSSSQEIYNKTTKDWTDILNKQNIAKDEMQSIGEGLRNMYVNNVAAKKQLVDVFKLQEFITIVILCIFIFVMILMYLLKYFGIYSKIWNIFFNKK